MTAPLADLPTIAIVSPSYNHAHVLEETIRSVLDQGYPKLQYVVADGGSTDGTRQILERYHDRLHAVIDAPDRGPHDAINKGFALTDGAVMGWLNSDDTLLPGSLLLVGSLFRDFPEIRWLTGAYTAIDALGRPVVAVPPSRWTRRHLLAPTAGRWISQTSTFWRRDLWEEAGGSMGDIWPEGEARSFPHNFDFELWARFSRYAELHTVVAPIGCHRHIEGQDSSVNKATLQSWGAVIRKRERPTTLRDRAAAGVAFVSALLGRLRLNAVDGAVAGTMGAPRLIVFDVATHSFRRRKKLETLRKLVNRTWKIWP